MFKRRLVLLSSIASLMAIASSSSFADDDRRGYRSDHRKDYRNEYRNEYRNDHRRAYRWDRRNRNTYNRGYWRHGRYYGPRYNYFSWRPGPGRGWGQAYLGGAILGSALTYSIVHNHRDCDDRSHDHGSGAYRADPRYEIEGCYRIEQLPDGRERRVDLPLAECR